MGNIRTECGRRAHGIGQRSSTRQALICFVKHWILQVMCSVAWPPTVSHEVDFSAGLPARPEPRDVSTEWARDVFSLLRVVQRLEAWHSASESESHCDWQSVSQSVLLGVEPRLGITTKYLFWLKVTVLSKWGALSDERSGLSFVSHSRQ
jgi:hypothetical protein